MLGTFLLFVAAYVAGHLIVSLIALPFRPRLVAATAELRYAPTLVPVDLEVVHVAHTASAAGPSTTYTYAATPFDGDDVIARVSPLTRPDAGLRTPASVGLLYTDPAGEHWLVLCNEEPAVAA